MAILGVTNRTENWKTARHFAPLFGANSVRLARRLLAHDEGERVKLRPGDVRLELFWYGMRDHLHGRPDQVREQEEQLADSYLGQFGEVRQQVEKFVEAGKLKDLTENNYRASSDDQKRRLRNNLRNTEIDIALESPSHLFIGEAKHESDFSGNSEYILPHQLTRQYVMASILTHVSGRDRTVVPFVVGDSRADLLKQSQVQFMLAPERKWLREENVLEWSDIEALW